VPAQLSQANSPSKAGASSNDWAAALIFGGKGSELVIALKGSPQAGPRPCWLGLMEVWVG
jgi:hypothetical protein